MVKKSEVKKCPKCGGRMVNETLEWKCPKCGYTECIEPEYCPPGGEG
jgi:ribosomal protein S27AE